MQFVGYAGPQIQHGFLVTVVVADTHRHAREGLILRLLQRLMILKVGKVVQLTNVFCLFSALRLPLSRWHCHQYSQTTPTNPAILCHHTSRTLPRLFHSLEQSLASRQFRTSEQASLTSQIVRIGYLLPLTVSTQHYKSSMHISHLLPGVESHHHCRRKQKQKILRMRRTKKCGHRPDLFTVQKHWGASLLSLMVQLSPGFRMVAVLTYLQTCHFKFLTEPLRRYSSHPSEQR